MEMDPRLVFPHPDALALAAIVREHHRAVFPLDFVFDDNEYHATLGALSASSFQTCMVNSSGSAEGIWHAISIYFKRYVN